MCTIQNRIERTFTCDVLVVGAGLAGLRAAYDCAAAGLRVLVAVKGTLCSGASFYPLTEGLGSQLPLDEADKPAYLQEVLETGAGIADPELVQILIDSIEPEARRLPELGIEPDIYVNTGRPACFAKRQRKLAVWRGWQGIRSRAREIFAKLDGVTVLEHSDLLRIVKAEGRVAGALLSNGDGSLDVVHTGCVVLATGGYCGLYKHSLNTPDVCGIGHSVALDAGAALINLEFMQFIPGLTAPRYQTLFNEYTLVHVTKTENDIGQDILAAYLPPDVSMADCLTDRAMHGPFTAADRSRYFDLAIMDDAIRRHNESGLTLHYDAEIFTDQNPYCIAYVPFLKSVGVDLRTQNISIAPFAHCANGGIRIDRNGATSVPGLFAAGEAAGGVHGADRHGGLATAASIVFGARAAASAVRYARENAGAPDFSDVQAVTDFMEWLDCGPGHLSTEQVHQQIGEVLWYRGNVLRTGAELRTGLEQLVALQRDYAPLSDASCSTLRKAVQVYHDLRTAQALLCTMLFREESRGSHYRADFPEKKKELEGKRTLLYEENGKQEVQMI
jgi:fumarate reductase (CoM/CoB) subunit A